MKNEPKKPAATHTETTLSPSELTTSPGQPSRRPREHLEVRTDLRAGGRTIQVDRPYRK